MTPATQAMRDALAICGAILELAELEIRGQLTVAKRGSLVLDIEKRATAIRAWADATLKEK